ncbi:LysR family transcriptional regulator ArgP [Oleidesulfovibrio sp.]|uniref:LysR family transcriptional regulator ArgP n=1 Tax=Oleidesulfovibrio sp. TaxID=2909707 RepID=UPI003A89373C
MFVMLEYRLIEALAMVAREGGFEKAARVLHVTQSAVSQRIRQLETAAGTALVTRAAPVRPTEAGRRLLRHYHQVAMLEADLERDMAARFSAELSAEGSSAPRRPAYRQLSVAVNADSLATWFLGAVDAVAGQEHLLLDVLVDDQDRTHDLLRNGEVVGCVSTRSAPFHGCSVQYLGCMEYLVCAAPDFTSEHALMDDGRPASATALLEAPAVLYNRVDGVHDTMLQQLYGVAPEAPYPRHYVPSSEAFVNMVAAGFGWGCIPHLQADPLIESGELVNLAEGWALPVALYWHWWDLGTELFKRMASVLTDHAAMVLR